MPDIKPIILGQAPSQLGDGRPFSGPSGHTLCTWAGVSTRDELLQHFDLANLINHPLPRRPRDQKESTFSLPEGRVAAKRFLFHTRKRVKANLGPEGWNDFIDCGERITVVALGVKVWRSFGLPRSARHFERHHLEEDFAFICFPHPSGLNHQLNDPVFAREVCINLRRLAGLPIA